MKEYIEILIHILINNSARVKLKLWRSKLLNFILIMILKRALFNHKWSLHVDTQYTYVYIHILYRLISFADVEAKFAFSFLFLLKEIFLHNFDFY